MNYWLSCFFGLNLSQKFYVHTDNLSRTLQQKEMSAVKGWELADLSVKTLQALARIQALQTLQGYFNAHSTKNG